MTHEDFNDSARFNPWWESRGVKVTDVVTREWWNSLAAINQHLKHGGKGTPSVFGYKVMNTFVAFMYNLYRAYLETENGLLTLNMSREIYYNNPMMIPDYVTHDAMVLCRNHLEENGYIINYSGFYNHKTGEGRKTRVQVTDKLIKLFKTHKITYQSFRVSEDEPLVVMRDDEGNDHLPDLTYSNMTANLVLKEFRRMAAKIKFSVDNPTRVEQRKYVNKADFWNVRMKRIYKQDDGLGGRLYNGFWTNWPKQLRSKITINKQAVVELDYSNLHTTMLYIRKGLEPPMGDLYKFKSIKGVPEYDNRVRQWRKFIKWVTNAMLNCKSSRQLHKLVRTKYNEFINPPLTKDGNPIKTMKFPKGYVHSAKALNAIKDSILKKHAPVSHLFFNPRLGLGLQRLDSDIAMRLVLHFQNKGILCMSEHDSFLVAKPYEQELKDKMQEFFKEVMNTEYEIGVG